MTRLFYGSFAGFILLASVAGCSGEPVGGAGIEDSTQGANAALTVSVVAPASVLWPDVITANGAIAPWQEATVNAEISGARLVEVLVDVGDKVEAGALLARFDTAQANALYAQQNAALADAVARLVEAAANAKRAKQLVMNKSMSEQDLIKAVTTEQAASAQVDLARARLASQKLNLDNARVVAPDAGVVSSRSAMLGMVATPGFELFRLIRQNRLEWQAELTAASLSAVSNGDAAEIYLADGQMVTGKVRQVSPVLNSRTRTGIVYVSLSGVDANDARIGMYSGGTIVVGEREGITVPSSAVVQRDGYEYVFNVDVEDGRVSQRKVKTGRRFANRIEIVEGVTVNDAVVLNGAAFLNDGDRVHIVDQPAAGPYTLGGTE